MGQIRMVDQLADGSVEIIEIERLLQAGVDACKPSMLINSRMRR